MSLPPEQTDLQKAAAAKLGVPADSFTLIPKKRSVDARKEPVFVWTVELTFSDCKKEAAILRKFRSCTEKVGKETPYRFPAPTHFPKKRPVVVGFGPAGIFCALMLARSGFAPIVLERGDDVDERTKKVEAFCKTGVLDPKCNVQFGEGGAGAFSDGKLNTLVKDKSYRGGFVLEQFVKAGAPEEILYVNKPHVGTDLLRNVIKTMRKEIVSRGGTVLFGQKMTGLSIENGAVCGVKTEDGSVFETDTVVLAIGHSARDTFRLLYEKEIPMATKPFSVGVRIEHPQRMIDESQYGKAAGRFPHADYKLVCHTENGRTVYTFCMCPGGTVMAAASDEDGVVTNGMSCHARDGENANSALLCEVKPEDVGDGLFAGMEFQRELEKAAFRLGGGEHKAPAQTVGDFLKKQKTVAFGDVRPSYPRGVTGCDLHELLPGFVSEALEQALPVFGRQIKGFDRPDAVMTGVESRTTSPIRILREEDLQSPVKGLYPCGEGAGYAGGILSAAIDGIKVAEQIVTK